MGVNEHLPEAALVDDATADFLPLPVREIQEGEDRRAAGAWAQLRVRPVVGQVAVARRLRRRSTRGRAVSV